MKIVEFYELTTTPECSEDRTAVPSILKTESAHLFPSSAYVFTTHAFTNNLFWVGLQAPQPFIYPFVYQSTCTTVGLAYPSEQGEWGR